MINPAPNCVPWQNTSNVLLTQARPTIYIYSAVCSTQISLSLSHRATPGKERGLRGGRKHFIAANSQLKLHALLWVINALQLFEPSTNQWRGSPAIWLVGPEPSTKQWHVGLQSDWSFSCVTMTISLYAEELLASCVLTTIILEYRFTRCYK